MVSSYLQLLEKRYTSGLDDEAREFIGFAVNGAQRMKQLIDDLLDYSRIGTLGNPPKAIDAEAALADALTDLSLSIAEAGATVTHDPLPIVPFDPTQLRRLLLNLIGNAIKFHSDAPPTVHVRMSDEGNYFVGSVQDNGIGIDPRAAQRVFVVFQRLHAKDKYPGTGIGLAVCKKIVERHGGRLWVDSIPGRGATFFFTIPKVKENIDYERCAA